MILEIKDVACGYGSETVISGLSLQVGSGEILCILGPNGVGKTTFFKTLLGFLKMKGGGISINGDDIHHWSRKKLAKSIAYVPQTHTPPFPFLVKDVVTMGRTVHLGDFAAPSKIDEAIAVRAMEVLDISFLKNRMYTEISGGERQMVLIARALTQEPSFLIMDEPTSNLDFGNQIRVLEQIKKLAESGLGIVMTSHFPDHAFLCSSKVALFQKNNNFVVGSADEVVTEDNLRNAYGVNVKIITTTDQYGNSMKACIPLLS